MNIFARHAKIVVLCGVFAAGTSGVLGKLIEAPSMIIGFCRLLITLPIFVIPVLLYHREELKAVKKREFIWSVASGIFLFIHYMAWFTSVKETAIASATVLMSLHPLFVAAMAYFVWKNKVSIKALMGVMIAIVGGIVVVGGNFTDGNSLYGDILAFISCVGMGIYFSIGSEIRNNISAAVYIMLVFGTCFICFAITIVVTSTPVLGYPPSDYLWILVMAIVCQLGAHAVFNWALGYVSSLYVSAVDTGEILVAAFLALIIFGEIPTIWQIIGGVIVIAGLLYYNYHEGDKA